MGVGQEISQFLRRQYAKVAPVFNEKSKRFWAGVLWLTPFVLGLAKSVVISSSLFPGMYRWPRNSPRCPHSIR